MCHPYFAESSAGEEEAGEAAGGIPADGEAAAVALGQAGVRLADSPAGEAHSAAAAQADHGKIYFNHREHEEHREDLYFMFTEEHKIKCNKISEQIIGCAIEVHKILGPGLLESAYEACLCFELAQKNLNFKR